jgi:RNA polymerase sigma-70 factor (ECF subfamily)
MFDLRSCTRSVGNLQRYSAPLPAISRTNAVPPHPSMFPEPFDARAELALVLAVLAGQETAIVEFEQRMLCVPRILNALNNRRGRPLDEHDLADLVQDTVLVVLRKLTDFKALAPLEAWIYRLCDLEFMNAARRRGRAARRTIALTEATELAAAAPDALWVHEEVHQALAQVGGVEAETIRLKHFDGLTFPEIGERLGVPPSTAKTRYYRGLERLTALLRICRRREESA